ncbi:exosortase/archaeosortase family protein [Urbifossiella limnaea]|uniref:Transmembrane exosortase (Exosortase_EpsH) n=1 Tax=Urbifossiella limnaea TaxID=2528023 RepID=A0A517Y300_9BACT|nr:exosortase/archaeosortase family protein [Urbifossiella limnaea]QDU24145.1 Transmembrane exosortase (Exosortase_EpsH) [Urbifossiella limnaea]
MALPRNTTPVLLSVGVPLAVTLWAYWSALDGIVERWATDPQYSHGFLVPVFSVYLLWTRRDRITAADVRPRWWGVLVVVLGGGVRMAGQVFYQPWLDEVSLLIVLAGLIAVAGGRELLAWAAPAVLFLAFMIPLPYGAQTLLGGRLQATATAASTYALQTFGVPAVAEGNVILLTDARLGVVEACSGLTMLVTFFALSVGVAFLVRRSWPEKVILVAAAAPIAVVANVVRITLTGLLFEANRGDLARAVFHDLAGWLMMPVGLTLLLTVLCVLSRAVVPAGRAAPATTAG